MLPLWSTLHVGAWNLVFVQISLKAFNAKDSTRHRTLTSEPQVSTDMTVSALGEGPTGLSVQTLLPTLFGSPDGLGQANMVHRLSSVARVLQLY